MNVTLHTLQQALDDARAGRCTTTDLVARWRQHAPSLTALPPVFAQALDQLLLPLESGSLFTEESCSFSQHDLFDNLQVWLDKATARLAAG